MTAYAWPRGRWGWAAGFGVAALVFLTALDLSQHYRAPLGAELALGLTRGLSLALAWLRPRVALFVSLVVTGITAAVTVPNAGEPWPWGTTAAFGTCLVLAIVGARGLERHEVLTWWIIIQVLGVGVTALAPDRGGWSGLFVMAVLSAAALVVAELLRSRAEVRRLLAEQEVITKEERAERSRLLERARIARELHDVVAHHLSVVVVRADSAPHRLPTLRDDVREEFVEIADAARASLTEMRRVLRLLREPLEQPPLGELGPQPGLEQLEELVASTRQAGADVRLEAGVPTGLDPAVELTAYRVVQEALSNAVRHSPRSSVQVTVRRDGGELTLEVRNGPAQSDERPVRGSGQGLVGMRERVALLDGTVSAGPTPEGGYLVEASIPVGEEVASGDQGAGG
ncbi:sensor histidine kinase [Kribbella sp. NPDC023972]|uniref:sensor histidine kinase n=1 Tax=Kribbella sp. NPDC023972 TaxID=3154795 RepID=UPI0033FEC0DE